MSSVTLVLDIPSVDNPRFQLLIRSIQEYFPYVGINRVILICPDKVRSNTFLIWPSIHTECYKSLPPITGHYLYLTLDTFPIRSFDIDELFNSGKYMPFSHYESGCLYNNNRLIRSDLVCEVGNPINGFPKDRIFCYIPSWTKIPFPIIYDQILPLKSGPLISCLMVTHNRLPMVKQRIQNFLDQTYSNKELIIVDDSDDGVEAYVNKLNQQNIRVYQVENRTLGELRNYSVYVARGKYVCQWDDDDYYHPSRLGVQYQHLINTKTKACLLQQWLIACPKSGQYGISHKRKKGWEGSILVKKSVMSEYPDLKMGEDTVFMDRLFQTLGNHNISVIKYSGHWLLYGYLVHGKNTWDSNHFDQLLSLRTPISKVWHDREEEIAKNLTHLLNQDYCGYNDESFRLIRFVYYSMKKWLMLGIILILFLILILGWYYYSFRKY